MVLRVWAAAPGRITVAGRGMWLVHLLLGDIHHRSGPGGHTITFGAHGVGAHGVGAHGVGAR